MFHKSEVPTELVDGRSVMLRKFEVGGVYSIRSTPFKVTRITAGTRIRVRQVHGLSGNRATRNHRGLVWQHSPLAISTASYPFFFKRQFIVQSLLA